MAKDLQIHLSWLEPELFRLFLIYQGLTGGLPLGQISSGVVWQSRDLHLSRNTLYLSGPRLCFFIVFKRDLFVYRDYSLISLRVIMRTEHPTKCLDNFRI